MTEMLFELEDTQYLSRRGTGTPYWDHNKFRKPPRIALNGLDTRRVAMILRRVRDSVNADPAVLQEAEAEAVENDTARGVDTSEQTHMWLGSTALEQPIEH